MIKTNNLQQTIFLDKKVMQMYKRILLIFYMKNLMKKIKKITNKIQNYM